MTVPLPATIRPLIGQNSHPGLALDKYVDSWTDQGPPGDFSGRVQRPALETVVRIAATEPAGMNFSDLLARRKAFLAALAAQVCPCETAGPFTLHLARASALENAGVCLHPIYGFPFLPGSGIKGLARAFATLHAGNDPLIPAVFGNVPGAKSKEQCAGGIIFHDSWPAKWTGLVDDILNCHHKEYYQAADGPGVPPPGDWDEPNMVSFLSIPSGVTFDFPLSKRRFDVPDEVLLAARQWLLGGLTILGAGAKTASGYGHFKPVGDGVSELRVDYGPGYRMYFVQRGKILIVLLCGGDKRTQSRDIRTAKALAADLED